MAVRTLANGNRRRYAAGCFPRNAEIHTGVGSPAKRSKARNLKCFCVMLFIAFNPFAGSFADAADAPVVTPLMLTELPDISGKEVLVLTVDYPPRGADPVHRHDAHAFVYVLEGSVVMQVRGGKEVTLTPGQTFYEGPSDVHIIGRNASSTKSARFLVFLLKNKGADALLRAR
jgi:quercetin dioxygenase-like cupin family protein